MRQQYTDHGHCGVLKKDAQGNHVVDNDATLAILAEMAVVYADAGADVVAPSDMMDGRVARIRAALDAHHHVDTLLLSYAMKYCRALFTVRSATPQTAHPNLEIARRTKWIPEIRVRLFAKPFSMLKKGPTC